MDFQSLTRKELQTLCKKNKIPANMTNVAMADALKALQNVEGLEEFLNPSESQNPQSPEKPDIGSPEIPRTVCRTSTRRRPIKAAEEPESSQTLTRTRRGTRRITEEVNQVKSEVPQTPGVPSSRKRAPAASARQKTVTRVEQSSVQRVYSTRRSARLSEKMGRTEPMEVEFSKVMTKDLDGDEEENKGAALQTISKESSTITDVSDQKSTAQSENDSKAEVEEDTGESAKPNNSNFLEVSEVKDEARDEGNTEAELQKNSEVDCEKMDESADALLSKNPKTSVHLNDENIVEKDLLVDHPTDTDVSSVTMSNTENLNEDSKLENEQPRESDLELNLTAPPQFSVDDSSCDSEKPELNLSAFADEVVCQNPVIMDSEMNVASKENLNEDLKLENEQQPRESDLELNLTAPPQASLDDSSCDSEKPELSLSAFADEVVCQNPVIMDSEMNDSSCDSEKPELNLSAFADEIVCQNSVIMDSEMNVASKENLNEDLKLENEQPRESDLKLNLTAPPQVSVDDSSCDSEKPELSLSAFADEAVCQNPVIMDSEMNVASEGKPENDNAETNQGDCEEFDMDFLQKPTEAQVELEFAKQGSMDFEDVSPSSGYDPMPETGEPNSKACINVSEIINSVETLAKEDEMSVVYHELITAEENATAVDEFLPLLNNFQTPVKLLSPHRPVSNTAVSGRIPLSPLAASPLLSQAPVPTLSTPTRKSSKKPSATQKMTLLSDNKENLDNSGRKMVLITETGKKKNGRDTAKEDIMLKKLNDTSLRQLRKMFKEKLQIKENTNKNNEDINDVKEVAQKRPALETLPENSMAEVETGKENCDRREAMTQLCHC